MTRAFAPHFDAAGVKVVQRGALDGLTHAEIARDFAPHIGSVTYVSKLLSGESVEIAKSAIVERMQTHVNELASTCDALVIVCTGEFPMLTSDVPMFFPDRLLVEAVSERLTSGKLGLIVPLAGQEPAMAEKWQSLGLEITIASASPYAASDVEGAARTLVADGASIVVLDCIGYTTQHGDRARSAIIDAGHEIPVLVPQVLVPAAVAAKLDLSERK